MDRWIDSHALNVNGTFPQALASLVKIWRQESEESYDTIIATLRATADTLESEQEQINESPGDTPDEDEIDPDDVDWWKRGEKNPYRLDGR